MVPEKAAVGQGGGRHRGDGAGQFRDVFPDQVDNGRAGARNVESGAVRGQFTRQGGGHFLGAEGGFRNAGEAETLQGGDQLPRLQVGVDRHPGRRQGGVDPFPGLKEEADAADVVPDAFRAGRANPYAAAAGDAALGDDIGPLVLHPDGLDRTLADAFVTVLAECLLGVDGEEALHDCPLIPDASRRPCGD